MPNQNFRGKQEEVKLGDCHVANNFRSHTADKTCRFDYSNFCPVCDSDSTRKRPKSDNLELRLQKRGRDNLKLSPKKNGVVEIKKEVHTSKDTKFGSSRVRSNLCELPTSYINSNCQNKVPSNTDKPQSKKFSDYNNLVFNLDYLKTYSNDIHPEYPTFLSSKGANVNKPDVNFIKAKSADSKRRSAPKHLNLLTNTDTHLEKAHADGTHLNKTKNLNGVVHSKFHITDIATPHTNYSKKKEKSLSPSKETHKEVITRSKSPNNKTLEKEKVQPKHQACLNCDMNNLPMKTRQITHKVENKKATSPKREQLEPLKLEKHHTNERAKSPLSACLDLSPESPKKFNHPSPVSSIKTPTTPKSPLDNGDIGEIKRQRMRQGSGSYDMNTEQFLEIVKKGLKKKPREVSPPEPKKEVVKKAVVKFTSSKSRHKLSTHKLRKVRNKIAHSVSSDSNFSDR